MSVFSRWSGVRQGLKTTLRVLDVPFLPFLVLAAFMLKFVRMAKVQHMPVCRNMLKRIGVFPIIDHYYEPLFNDRCLRKSLQEDRIIEGLDLDIEGQLAFLKQLDYADEISALPVNRTDSFRFFTNNGSFHTGDAEIYYSLIRRFRPARILEIGCGASTLAAMEAVKKNREEDPEYTCEITCVEPYEQPWLEHLGVRVIREPVERLDKSIVTELEANDVFFVDSSHIIRPQGDVCFEILELVGLARPGVFVHFHDIFTPKDYPRRWIVDDVLFWNEQYLLEAFLAFNQDFRIVCAAHHLSFVAREALDAVCPRLAEDPNRHPGSFWIQRVTNSTFKQGRLDFGNPEVRLRGRC